MCEISFKRVQEMVRRFCEAEHAIVYIINAFEVVLPYCVEHLELKQINELVKVEIFNRFGRETNNFEDLRECMASLHAKARANKHIGFFDSGNVDAYENAQFDYLNRFVEAKDELSVHEVGYYIREAFLAKLDFYLADLVEFRNNSTQEFERFELELNGFLIDLVRNDANNQKRGVSQQLGLKNVNELIKSAYARNYKNDLFMYRRVLHELIGTKPETSPSLGNYIFQC